MKKLFMLLFLAGGLMAHAQEGKGKQLTSQVVEASCGQCKFGMKDKKGCDLAVRIDGKSYFVDGTGLNDHGDAHADDGFCSMIRKAEVTGTIQGDKFKASSFKLLPAEKDTKAKVERRKKH